MALVTVDSAELVISCAIKVHSATGPGMFEPVYELCNFNAPRLKEGLKSVVA